MKNPDQDSVMMALAYPFERGGEVLPDVGRLLLANAVPAEGSWEADRATVWQSWKGPATAFEKDGFTVSPDEPAVGEYAGAFVRVPRQREEAQYALAAAWNALEKGGLFVAAAANDAGGGRLEKDLSPHLPALQGTAKYKCKIVWCQKTTETLPSAWIEKGRAVRHAEGFWTQAGLFSWDRVDPATVLLLSHIPAGLSGVAADLGCGTGVIANALLKTSPDLKGVICIDADARAVAACKANLVERHAGRAVDCQWIDLSVPQKFPVVDMVVMNPPFHDEKKQAITLGQAFIVNAAGMLKPGGTLLMVANAHLPYEDILAKHFKTIEKLHEGQGFKIFRAKR